MPDNKSNLVKLSDDVLFLERGAKDSKDGDRTFYNVRLLLGAELLNCTISKSVYSSLAELEARDPVEVVAQVVANRFDYDKPVLKVQGIRPLS